VFHPANQSDRCCDSIVAIPRTPARFGRRGPEIRPPHRCDAGTALQFVPASVNQLSFPCNTRIRFGGQEVQAFMIFGLFGQKNRNRAIVDRQYASLTSAARVPFFYTDLDVPDTVMGRFEMVSVVMILFFRRTAKSGTSGQELAQEIIDAFFQDIDHSIRELGIGDQAVPKRMKKLAGMFYGRLEAYGNALEAGDAPVLSAALRRNFYPSDADAPAMDGLGRWMLEAQEALAAVSEDDIARGMLTLPLPAKGGHS
jgi:cytochrome b pre-mRNA-processing protein 3